jgi:hypothetical protein
VSANNKKLQQLYEHEKKPQGPKKNFKKIKKISKKNNFFFPRKKSSADTMGHREKKLVGGGGVHTPPSGHCILQLDLCAAFQLVP